MRSDKEYLYNGKELQDDMIGGTQLNWYCYEFRFYDPQTGRFTTQDPLSEKFSHMTPYVYAANNPIRFIDVLGLAPGDPFKTMEAAAKDFGKCYNDNSIAQGREFGTRFYKTSDGNFSYGVPIIGERSSVANSLSEIPENSEYAGDGHTHGDFKENYVGQNFDGNNEFSYDLGGDGIKMDIEIANEKGKPSFLATPNGKLQMYDPSTKQKSVISTDMPSDKNDPTRVNSNSADNPNLPKNEPAISEKEALNKIIQAAFDELKFTPPTK